VVVLDFQPPPLSILSLNGFRAEHPPFVLIGFENRFNLVLNSLKRFHARSTLCGTHSQSATDSAELCYQLIDSLGRRASWTGAVPYGERIDAGYSQRRSGGLQRNRKAARQGDRRAAFRVPGDHPGGNEIDTTSISHLRVAKSKGVYPLISSVGQFPLARGRVSYRRMKLGIR